MGNKFHSFVKAGFPVTALGLQAPELEEEAGEASVLYPGEINLQAGLIEGLEENMRDAPLNAGQRGDGHEA